MKFPKLKHPTLCQILLYLPAFTFFVAIFLNIYIADTVGGLVAILFFAGGAAFSLWYLIKNAILLIASDMIFSEIRYWKTARTVYFTERNGRNLATAEKRILRCLRGKSVEPLNNFVQPIAFRYQRRRPLSVFYFAIEKMTLVYSVDVLTEDNFRQIMASAKQNAQKARVQKSNISTFLMEKAQKNAQIVSGTAVVILAQRSEIEITERTVQASSGKFGCIAPCVAVLDQGAYYMDAMREAYMLGMTEKPAKNFVVELLRKVVFDGKFPCKGNNNLLPFVAPDINPEMTLWELMRLSKDAVGEAKKEERKLVKKLRNGEVLYEDALVYCKLGERTASFIADEKEGVVEIFFDGMWSYPKINKISKKDEAELRQRIETYFVTNGKRVKFLSDT